jgi:hypothetical protein
MSQMQYNIIFTGTNLTGGAVNSVKQGLTQISQAGTQTSVSMNTLSVTTQNGTQSLSLLGTTGTQSLNNVKTASQGAAQGMMTFEKQSYQGFRTLQMGGMMGISIMSTLYMRQMSLENSQDSLTQAQENYNNAVLESGAGSKQALTALNQLERAQRSYQSAQTMSTLMTVSAGVQLVGFGAQVLHVLPKINSLTSSLRNLASAGALAKAFSGPAGWAMLAGGVAAAGAAGYAIGNMNSQPQTANVNVNVNSQQDIYLQYLQRLDKNNVSTLGG